MTATAKAVEWMVSQIREEGTLYQGVAVSHIAETFGRDLVTINAGGNQALAASLLAAFNKATDDAVIWSRSGLFWRAREDFDLPGRMQP